MRALLVSMIYHTLGIYRDHTLSRLGNAPFLTRLPLCNCEAQFILDVWSIWRFDSEFPFFNVIYSIYHVPVPVV